MELDSSRLKLQEITEVDVELILQLHVGDEEIYTEFLGEGHTCYNVIGFAFLHAYHPASTFQQTAEVSYFFHRKSLNIS